MITELPITLVSGLERRLTTTATAMTSPFTGTQEVQDWGGEWWEYQVTMALTRPPDGRRLSAFFAALGGVRGRFLFCDPSIEPPGNTGLGVVAGANQSGNALHTASWLVNTPLFQAGDFFSLGADAATRLYQITEDVASDQIGTATLRFVPRLRASPANGAPLEIANPKLVLRLTEPVPSRIGRAGKFQFTFTAREAL
jgi:hypothetical protein